MKANINGIMDTSYTYGNERLTNERFTGEVAYYTYDPRGSVSGLTDNEGMLYQSYRYDPFGGIDFGKPQYNNVYAYNAESYNGNTEHQYLRARYYDTDTADFLTEDSYLGKLNDPLTLNRYNYVKSSPSNYTDPSGHEYYVDLGKVLNEYFANLYQSANKEWNRRWNKILHPVETAKDALSSNKELQQLITNGKTYLNDLMETAKNSKAVHDCTILKAGIKFGIDSTRQWIESWTVDRIRILLGSDINLYDMENYQADYNAAFFEVYNSINKDREYSSSFGDDMDTFNRGMEIGFYAVWLEILGSLSQLAGVGSGTPSQGQTVMVQDTYGNVYTVVIPVEVAEEVVGSMSAEVILQQIMEASGKQSDSKDDGTGSRMTTKEATEAAKNLGYEKVNETSHGQPVYKNAKNKTPKFITPDVDSHNGGVWKGANSVKDLGSKSTRLGTYDTNLKWIGD